MYIPDAVRASDLIEQIDKVISFDCCVNIVYNYVLWRELHIEGLYDLKSALLLMGE
jgi:hypothetical protein